MKLVVFLPLLFVSSFGFAEINLYQLDIQSSVGAGAKSKTTLILKEGQFLSYVVGTDNVIEVMAEEYEENPKNISINFKVSREFEDGSVEILAEPRIVTLPKKNSGIVVGEELADQVQLEVKARKI